MDIVYGVGGLILGVGTMVLYTLVIGKGAKTKAAEILNEACLLYTSPSPRDLSTSRMPSSA